MNHDVPPLPGPDPRRLSLESLEQQLRKLPPPAVPDALPAKLIAVVGSTAATAAMATGISKLWLWIAGISIAGIVTSALVFTWLTPGHSKAVPGSNVNRNAPAGSATGSNKAATAKSIQDFEQAVRFDPYNADAWFNLAKAQAGANRSVDALSSAQNALDIARSRHRTALVDAIEAWMRSHRDTEPGRSKR